MTACGILWCVALTDKQFCPIHAKDQALHPKEIDPEDELEEAVRLAEDVAYEEGFSDAKERYEDLND